MAAVDSLASNPPAGRVLIDMHRDTARAALEELRHRIVADGDVGRMTPHIVLVAEQVFAIALGEPACDDPPLTDRRRT